MGQWCLTLCDPKDYTVHGILQARILEWVAFPFSRGSSQPRDRTQVSRIADDSLPAEPPGKPKDTGVGSLSLLQRGLPDPGIKLGSPALQADSLPAELPGKSFIRSTDAKAEDLILWPPDVKSQPIRKDFDAVKHWRQKEKGGGRGWVG